MNIVQFVGGNSMNTVVTSRKAILDVSRALMKSRGWAAVNIRAVAAACDVSVGTIYNYFGSKSELITATVESIWQDIFHFPEQPYAFDRFTDCLAWAFDCMKAGNEKYPGFFTLHSMGFLEEEKSNGKEAMNQSWRHIQNALYTVLTNDKNLRPGIFDQAFTPEKFVDIIFSLMVSALLLQNYDCSGILEITRRIIY